MSHFMIVLIPNINLLNLSWIIKCLFLKNIESLSIKNAIQIDSRQILNKFLSYFLEKQGLIQIIPMKCKLSTLSPLAATFVAC